MTRILRTIPLLYRNLLSRMAGFVSEREGTLWSAAVIGVVLIGSILSWRFWDKLGGNAESFSTTLRNVALVIGGVAAILLALWRSRVSERQTAIAQRQNETAQHQAEIARNSLLNERYQRGAEMLGSEILSARLGGIYALQQLAADYPEQYHLRVFRLFCGFVRQPTRDNGVEVASGTNGKHEGDPQTLRADVQDVMQAIIARSHAGIDLERRDAFKLYLRDANLSNLQLQTANLAGAWLTNANLSCAVLPHADLSYARLRIANLSGARLRNADLSEAVLWGANLSGAVLQDANMSGTDFCGTGARSPIYRTPVQALTQAQLDCACADRDNPPKLSGLLDAETGKPLVWRGKTLTRKTGTIPGSDDGAGPMSVGLT